MQGIIPSLHTPFNEKNEIDIPCLRNLIDHTISTGCTGMLVGAVAGENSSLSFDEKNILLNECVTYNKNRIPIIVSCTAKNQIERISLSKNAKELGADWILCQAPENIFVEGVINADIETETLQLKSTGIIVGDVFYRNITIESGGILKSQMVQNMSKINNLVELNKKIK